MEPNVWVIYVEEKQRDDVNNCDMLRVFFLFFALAILHHSNNYSLGSSLLLQSKEMVMLQYNGSPLRIRLIISGIRSLFCIFKNNHKTHKNLRSASFLWNLILWKIRKVKYCQKDIIRSGWYIYSYKVSSSLWHKNALKETNRKLDCLPG